MWLSDLSITPQGRFGAQVAFTITNTGMVAGAESAQVYVHQVASPVERPEIELKAFAKATLSPGQSKRVTVELDVSSTFAALFKPWALTLCS